MTTADPALALDSTQALVSRARAGESHALDELAQRYQPALTRFAHGRLPPAARGLCETADIVQVVVVRTLDRIAHSEVPFEGSLLAYLRRAVLNQVRDEIRRAQRRPLTEELSVELPALTPDPLAALLSKEAIERYDAALAGLPADQQEAFIMRIEMDCGYREIADALQRPTPEAARMLVRRAIRAMAVALRGAPAE